MLIDTLAMQAEATRTALELARTRLERGARRWSERPTDDSLRELQRSAASFRDAQRASDDAVRAWARATVSDRGSRSAVSLVSDRSRSATKAGAAT